MVRCSVLGCKSDSERKTPNLSFHSFPDDERLRQIWTEATGRINWTAKKTTKICSRHFDPNALVKKKKITILYPNAVPSLGDASGKSQQQKKEEIKEQQYDTFQESADEELLDVKQEISDDAENSDDNVSVKDTSPVTEKVYLNAIKLEQSEDGQTRSKRARILSETSEDADYRDEMYEFGKYVAEQLMCLNVEDASIAQAEIIAVLSKFNMNKIMTDTRTSNLYRHPGTSALTRVVSQVNPELYSITQSESKVKTAKPSVTQSMFLQVNTAGQSVTQLGSQVTTAEQSVTQLGSQMNTAGPSRTQSGLMLGPSLLGYVVVPATVTGLHLTTQLRNAERTLVLESASETSDGSTETRSPVSYAGTSVCQSGSSMISSEILVKTEPDSESSHFHVNVEPSEEPTNIIYSETLVKTEPDSKLSQGHVNFMLDEEGEKSLLIKSEASTESET